MAESDQRRRVVAALKRLHAIPVENGGVCPGTPDVAFIGGWIETKWMREWPRRPETIVKLDHELTIQQRLWHRAHAARGGRSWVLLQVRQEWMLIDGVAAALHLEKTWTRQDIIDRADVYWPTGLQEEYLARCVSQQ